MFRATGTTDHPVAHLCHVLQTHRAEISANPSFFCVFDYFLAGGSAAFHRISVLIDTFKTVVQHVVVIAVRELEFVHVDEYIVLSTEIDHFLQALFIAGHTWK